MSFLIAIRPNIASTSKTTRCIQQTRNNTHDRSTRRINFQRPAFPDFIASIPPCQPSPPPLAGGVLTVATIVGFALHFAGEVAYSTYLTHMGIQPSSFPQAADWKIIHGLFVALNQSAWFVEYMPLKRIAVALMIVTLPLVIAGAPAKQSPRLRHLLMRIPYWVRQPFVVYFFLVAILASAAAFGSLLLLGATMPGVVGERFGTSEATKHVERLKRGEFKAISELWKDDQRQMRGEIIVTGADLIALYDMDSKVMRTISRDSIEIRALLGLAADAGADSTSGSQ